MIYVFRLDETCKGIDKTKRPIKIEYGYFNNETLNKIKVIFETHLPDNYYWPTEQGHDGNKYLMMIYYNTEKNYLGSNLLIIFLTVLCFFFDNCCTFLSAKFIDSLIFSGSL